MADKVELITKILEFSLAVFSVGGAISAKISSKKVKKDVEYIEKVKEEIVNRENIEEIVKVKEEVTSIKKTIRNYTLKNSKMTTTGRSLKKDAISIQDSLTIIKENRNIFTSSDENQSDIIYTEINNLVDEMINFEDDEEKLKRIMRETDLKLDNFLATLKELKNSRKFK